MHSVYIDITPTAEEEEEEKEEEEEEAVMEQNHKARSNFK